MDEGTPISSAQALGEAHNKYTNLVARIHDAHSVHLRKLELEHHSQGRRERAYGEAEAERDKELEAALTRHEVKTRRIKIERAAKVQTDFRNELMGSVLSF